MMVTALSLSSTEASPTMTQPLQLPLPNWLTRTTALVTLGMVLRLLPTTTFKLERWKLSLLLNPLSQLVEKRIKLSFTHPIQRPIFTEWRIWLLPQIPNGARLPRISSNGSTNSVLLTNLCLSHSPRSLTPSLKRRSATSSTLLALSMLRFPKLRSPTSS